MSSTTEPMIAHVRQEVEGLLRYVTGPESGRLTANQVERTLFRRLLGVGALLLHLFFVSRAAARPAGPVQSPAGRLLTFHDRRPTSYFSVFGKLSFRRHAFTAPGQPVVCPLDAALSLPPSCYSDLLREWLTYGSTDAAFRETADLVERILGQAVSTQAIVTMMAADAADVAEFWEQPPDPTAPVAGGAILVAQADGKGVPLVLPPRGERPVRPGKGQPAGRKREAIVTAVYTIAPYPRTPEDVVAALMDEAAAPALRSRPRPIAKELRATLDGKAVALTRLAARVAQRTHAGIQHRVALTDGAVALQQQMRTQLPEFTRVLDIIHASEYLWTVATALLGERHPDRTAWVRTRLQQVLAGQTAAVIAEFAELATAPRLAKAKRAALLQAHAYYTRNLPFMRYDEYLAHGWPIGTGVVEGACGHLVKDRMEQAGMRWTKDGAHAVLDLRAMRLTGQWDAYWAWHRAHQHRRLYGRDAPRPGPIEDQLETFARAA